MTTTRVALLTTQAVATSVQLLGLEWLSLHSIRLMVRAKHKSRIFRSEQTVAGSTKLMTIAIATTGTTTKWTGHDQLHPSRRWNGPPEKTTTWKLRRLLPTRPILLSLS